MNSPKEVLNLKSRLDKLEKLSMPLKRFLEENYCQHCAVIITVDRAKVVSVETSTPLEDIEEAER